MALSPKLSKAQIASVYYHSKFDYPLTFSDLKKWQADFKVGSTKNIKVRTKKISKEKYFFIGGDQAINRRIKRQIQSKKKLQIAKKAAVFLKHIPTIKFVGITGSLAMFNADTTSDIDLMIITTSGTLWLTRGISLVLLKLFGYNLRKSGDKIEKDKLCLNLWLEETDLKWQQKNEFIAHEIAQINPLINKDKTFERFLSKNSWIVKFWPNAVKISKPPSGSHPEGEKIPRLQSWSFIENVAFKLQYLYMKKKITTEVVSLTRAQFHPAK
ncbi:MAG: nucleotidyltransferase domain-containing protein [Patescibacteria group bacterium]